MNSSIKRGRRRRVVAAIVIVGAAAVVAVRVPLRVLRRDVALHQLKAVASASLVCGVPLESDAGSMIRIAARLMPKPSSPIDAATRLADLVSGDETPRAVKAMAVARLVAGEPVDAARLIDSVPAGGRDAAEWADLATARMLASSRSKDTEDLIGALVAADRASLLDSHSAVPFFIRARIFETLALTPAALVAWRRCLTGDLPPTTAQVARGQVAALRNQLDDISGWKTATSAVEMLPIADLAPLTRRYPQQARTYAEGPYMSDWAHAVSVGDGPKAATILRRVRAIAEALTRQSGESLLQEVVESVERDASSGDARRLTNHAAAFAEYARGRVGQQNNPADAFPHLEEARKRFAAAGDPMAATSECFLAIALIDLNRAGEARRRLASLVASERAGGNRHKSLVALALYHLALCHASEGSWSEALGAGNEAAAIFASLNERGLAGTVEALISQSYAVVGDDESAWTHARRALALSGTAGDWRRVRVILAGLSRSELRRARWDAARSLIGIERSIARGSDAVLDTDMLLRRAAAEYHLGLMAESQRTLADARATASRASDAALRQKLVADVHAVSGTLSRPSDPRRALPLLSAAIAFQERTGRALLLPQLYLERGRASIALGRLGAAADDFESGIARLEEQRSRTNDAELRSGVFDAAGDLFSEAVSLALQQKDLQKAFGYAERGRARAILEEIALREGEAVALPGPVNLNALMRALPLGALLLDYQVLNGSIAIFAVERSATTVRLSVVSREELRLQVGSYADALTRGKLDIESISRRLFTLLLDPVRAQLQRASFIVLVPDPALQNVPFAALVDPKSRRFFVQDHSVTIAPSASVYLACVRRSESKARVQRPPVAAIFANPDLRGGSFGDLTPLPASEAEAFQIAKAYPHASVAVRGESTEARFRSNAGMSDIVHFAGHTMIRPAEPWHSAMILSPTRTDDGVLSVQKIARMSFPATRVVVLASCGTLRGHTVGVEGIPSVARAFIVGGVPSVVGTLWDVEDGETGALMNVLHQNLANGLSTADALRAAQLEAISSSVPEIRHPSHWAAFTVLGSGR